MSDTALVALLAAAIAFLGACIAWGQLNTARRKLSLDLFEKRLEVFKSVEAAIKRANSTKGNRDEWDEAMYAQRARIRFLFGRDVATWVIALQRDVYERLDALQARRDPHLSGQQLAGYEAAITAGYHRLRKARVEWVDLCAPYLRMDQKLPRPPQEWPAAFSAWLRRKWDERPAGE